MKKIVLLASVALMGMSLLTSCGGSKAVQGEVEIEVPCSDSKYMTNSEYIRASSVGLSSDMNVAKKKAMTSARTEIASSVETKVKSVVEHYVSSFQSGENDDTKQRYQNLTREVVNQKLRGIRPICQKVMKNSDGNYKVYVAIELAGSEIMEGMAAAIKDDEKMRLDFEYEKFKKVFEEEMNKID